MNSCRQPIAAAAVLLAILAGCGSAPAPSRSAEDEISRAERFMESAKDWDRKGQLEQALDNYKQAKELINKGIAFAEGNELSRLRNLEDDVRSALTKLEMRKLTQDAGKSEKPKVALNAQVKPEDPEEKKQKDEEAAKKKMQAGVAKANAEIEALTKSVSAPTSVSKKDTKDAALDSDVVEQKERTKAGVSKETGGEEAVPVSGLKAEGPFPALTDKSPAIEVCKLVFRGNAAIVYFQVYNKSETGRRIMNAVPFFKDANNQPLIDPRATAVFPYKSFKADAPNIFEQSLVTALTAGSAQVTGFEGLRLVGVGESDKVKEIKKVAVKVVYDDGKSDVDTGPKEGAAEVPGLKALEAKK